MKYDQTLIKEVLDDLGRERKIDWMDYAIASYLISPLYIKVLFWLWFISITLKIAVKILT